MDTFGKEVYVQVSHPHHAYVLWHKSNILGCCDDEQDYEDMVNELTSQGYRLINQV